MSFLEDLRKQKAVEEAAKAEASRQLKLKQREDEENKRKEEIEKVAKRTRNLKLALEAEGKFEESGLKEMVSDLLKINPSARFKPDLSDYARTHPETYGGDGKYSCEVILKETNGGHWDNDHTSDKTFIEIDTTNDGTITFRGGSKTIRVQSKGFLGFKAEREIRAPLEITINKDEWIRNRGVLEDALGKVYGNPYVSSRGGPSPYPWKNPGGMS